MPEIYQEASKNISGINCLQYFSVTFNILTAELNAVCHLLALLLAHPILNVSRIRVKGTVLNFIQRGVLFCKGKCLDASLNRYPWEKSALIKELFVISFKVISKLVGLCLVTVLHH